MTPDIEDIEAQADASQQATVIRYANEDEVGTFGEMNRVPVTVDQIPDSVINGVLSAEQRAFYDEPVISPSGTARAVLSLGSEGGGSGITQQMARNYYDGLSQERSYMRKIKEILISLKVGQTLSRDEILTQYLNTIYFGRNAYGVQAAAQAYFDKNVEDLNDAEGAFIGAIIQQPGNFENANPDDPMWDILGERWGHVVSGLPELHEANSARGVPQAEADALEFPDIVSRDAEDTHDGSNGYVIEAARRELTERYDLTDEQVNRGGYMVTTSIEEELMNAAEEAVSENRPEGTPEETNFGVAAIDPSSGEIRGFYGGENVFEDTDNSMLQWGQAGSSIKPAVLAAGLENGVGLRSTFDGDSPQTFEGVGDPIQNNANRSWGTVDLVESTAHSVNTSFVQLAVEVGPQGVRDMAGDLGLPDESLESAELGPNIALGTYSVTAVDQAAFYATFANQGTHLPQHMVTEVRDSEGNVLEPNDAEELEGGSEAMSPDAAADATHAMRQVVEDGGAESAALSDGRPVAGKTGTSNDAASAWFAGYTPQLATAVGIHRSDNEPVQIPGLDSLYGSTVPAAIWKDFMETAMEGEEVQDFPEPAWIGSEDSYLPTPEPSETPEETETPEEEEVEVPETPSELPTWDPCEDDWEYCDEDPGEPTESPDPTFPPPGGGDGGGDDPPGGGWPQGNRENNAP